MEYGGLVVLVVCVACVAEPGESVASTSGVTSTSGDGSTTGDPYTGQCDQLPTVLAGVDDVGITGRSASEVLAEVAGIHTGTIAWLADTPGNYVGSTEPSAVTLEIRYDGGEIRSVDAVVVHPCQHNGPCPCDDSLEIDVTWRLTSADGVLDESWTAPLVHQPASASSSSSSISHDFQPDDTAGSLDAASFDLQGGTALRRLVAQAELEAGAAQGSIATELEMLGGVGYGGAATFAAVRAVDDAACNAIDGEPECSWAGCTAVSGQHVSGTPPSCGCNAPVPFCFAGAQAGGLPSMLYTREGTGSLGTYVEVVAFPMLADPPPPPWRACADAPEVPECACTDPC